MTAQYTSKGKSRNWKTESLQAGNALEGAWYVEISPRHIELRLEHRDLNHACGREVFFLESILPYLLAD